MPPKGNVDSTIAWLEASFRLALRKEMAENEN
jgi:hypothetical protein